MPCHRIYLVVENISKQRLSQYHFIM